MQTEMMLSVRNQVHFPPERHTLHPTLRCSGIDFQRLILTGASSHPKACLPQIYLHESFLKSFIKWSNQWLFELPLANPHQLLLERFFGVTSHPCFQNSSGIYSAYRFYIHFDDFHFSAET